MAKIEVAKPLNTTRTDTEATVQEPAMNELQRLSVPRRLHHKGHIIILSQ